MHKSGSNYHYARAGNSTNETATAVKKAPGIETGKSTPEKTIAAQSADLEKLNQQFEQIEQNVMLEQIGKKVLTEDDRKAMKKQLSIVIGEIDKMLLTLND